MVALRLGLGGVWPRGLAGGGVPSWVLRDDTGEPALLQASPGRFWFDGAQYPTFAEWAAAVGTLTTTVSANGTRRDATGARVQATANVIRIDHDDAGSELGWLLEGGSANLFLNSEAPVTQTVSSPFNRTNIWMEGGGSVGISGPTTATATEDAPVYYDLSGNVTLTPSGDVDRVQVEKNNSNRVPSSYIPTAGSAVTRNADVFRMGPNGSNLPFDGFSGTAGTLVVQGRSGEYFNVVDQTAIQIDNGTNADRIKLYRTSSGVDFGMHVRAGGVNQAGLIYSGGFGGGRRFAVAAAYAANDIALCVDGAAEMADTSATLPTMTRIGIGEDGGGDFWMGHISLIAYFPRRVPDLAARGFYLSTPDRFRGLGDSFMSAGFTAAFRALLGSAIFTADGVGGSTLDEQLTRWTATPNFHDQILVMTDDMSPLTDSEADIAAMLATYASILSQLRGGRFMILEPGFPIGGVGGSSSRVERDNKWAAILAAYPDNVVPVTPAMQAAGDGSTLDNDYIAAGLWPGSCLVNPGTGPTTTVDGHLNTKGNGIYAQCAYDFALAKGWL